MVVTYVVMSSLCDDMEFIVSTIECWSVENLKT